MLKWLLAKAISQLFGDGFAAELAGRGTVVLADGVREAIDRDPEELTKVKLKPGESYLVVARPPATRKERRLKRQRRHAKSRLDAATRPTRRQLRSAKKLARTQRRLDRTRRSGSRRHRRLERREAERGARFDRLTAPTDKQVALKDRFDRVDAQLSGIEAERFDAARSRLRRRRTGRTAWFD